MQFTGSLERQGLNQCREILITGGCGDIAIMLFAARGTMIPTQMQYRDQLLDSRQKVIDR